MSTSFAITAAASSVTLVDRAGTATYSVTSNLAAPVRAQARLWTDNPANAGWITLEGEPVRQIAAGATESFRVSFRPGPDVPPGTYAYRLDVVDVDNPDDHGTQGPAGSVTVPAPVLQQVQKKFPWWVVAIAASLLLLAGGLAYAFSRDSEPAAVPTPTPTPTTTPSFKFTAVPFPTLIVPTLIRADRIHVQQNGAVLESMFFLPEPEYDLDTATQVGSGGDLRFEDGKLTADNGAVIQARGVGAFPIGKAGCNNGFAGVAGTVTTGAGARFCVKTNEGRIAELVVRAVNDSRIQFDVRTYA